jgi:hypothetical protein
MTSLRRRTPLALAVWLVAALGVGLAPAGHDGLLRLVAHRATVSAAGPAVPDGSGAMLRGEDDADLVLPAPVSGSDPLAGRPVATGAAVTLAGSGRSGSPAARRRSRIAAGGRLRPRSPPGGRRPA